MSKKTMLQQGSIRAKTNGVSGRPAESRMERLERIEKEVKRAIKEEKASDKPKKRPARSTVQAAQSVVPHVPQVKTDTSVKDRLQKMQFELLIRERDRLKDSKASLTRKVAAYEKILEQQNSSIRKLNHIIMEHKKQLEQKFDSKLLQLVEPVLQKSKNPVQYFKNYLDYIKRKKAYNHEVNTIARSAFTLNTWQEDFRIGTTGDATGRYKIDYLSVFDRCMKVGEKWARMYYLADIPSLLSPYLQFKLLASPLPFTLSHFVSPKPNHEMLKKSRQRISVLEAQQYQREIKGLTRDPQIDREIEETRVFADDLAYEREKGLEYALYCRLEAESRETLDFLHKEFINLTESMELVFNTYSFGQKEALKTLMPFGEDVIEENRVMQSMAGSYSMPFVAKPLYNPKGIFIGMNVYHNSLVFLNPFTTEETENNNVNIFGTSGSGKSVTSKIFASRMYMQGTQIIIVDPEGEYVKLARKLGGEVIQFSRANGINPFSVAGSEKDQVMEHITMLKTFFRFFTSQDKYAGAKLDKILVDLYKNYPSTKPTFKKFLTAMKKTAMHEDLAVLSEGSLKGVFNSERELELTNDFIVFDLSALSEDEIKKPAMYLLTSLIWQLVNTISERQRMLFIDEAHTLLKDIDVAKDYQRLVKLARKRNMGVVSITQDVEDFLNHDLGRAIINNSASKILLKQSYAAIGLMDNIFPMTEAEKKNLGELRTGEAVIFRGNDHIAAYIKVLASERELVFTDYGKENRKNHQRA